MSDTKRIIAYCPGSFDPITNGHVDIVQRACPLFCEVIVAVADEAQKQFLFDLDERVSMCRQALAHLDGVRVEPFSGLLVTAAREAGARVIIKGLRQSFDLSHEAPMAYMNHSLQPDVETMFMLSSPACAHISSSLIKWVCSMGGDISAHVPAEVARRLREKLGA